MSLRRLHEKYNSATTPLSRFCFDHLEHFIPVEIFWYNYFIHLGDLFLGFNFTKKSSGRAGSRLSETPVWQDSWLRDESTWNVILRKRHGRLKL